MTGMVTLHSRACHTFPLGALSHQVTKQRAVFEYLFVSTECQREGGEQRCQSFGDQSRDEQQEMLGGRAGVGQRQRAKRADKTREPVRATLRL